MRTVLSIWFLVGAFFPWSAFSHGDHGAGLDPCVAKNLSILLIEKMKERVSSFPVQPSHPQKSASLLDSQKIADWAHDTFRESYQSLLESSHSHRSVNSMLSPCSVPTKDKESLRKLLLATAIEAKELRLTDKFAIPRRVNKLELWSYRVTYWLTQVTTTYGTRYGMQAAVIVLVYEFLDHVILHQHWACNLFPLVYHPLAWPFELFKSLKMLPSSLLLSEKLRLAVLTSLNRTSTETRGAWHDFQKIVSNVPYLPIQFVNSPALYSVEDTTHQSISSATRKRNRITDRSLQKILEALEQVDQAVDNGTITPGTAVRLRA